jgi:hypothetical protein
VATDREWATGYFEQASADLLGVKAVGSASPSVAAMLWRRGDAKAEAETPRLPAHPGEGDLNDIQESRNP